jgi:hypothetical protein
MKFNKSNYNTGQKGYLALGASTMEDAKAKTNGMQIYMRRRPNLLQRLCLRYLLGMIWVDEVR